jgi:hypothetical protein
MKTAFWIVGVAGAFASLFALSVLVWGGLTYGIDYSVLFQL